MILVTGGTGLLGSHLLYELVKNGQSVRAMYRDSKRIEKVKTLFDYYSKNTSHHFDSIEWVKGDVLDLVSLEDAMVNIKHVYHCAAFVSFRKKDFKQLIRHNSVGTANVVNIALKFGVEKFGHVSSTAAIGGTENMLVTEKTKWQISDKTSGYAISKYNSEREVWRATEEGMDVIIVNPCLIFGAGDLHESSLSIFNTVKKGLRFYAPGSNAYVDARDVAACFVQLMESEIRNERYLLVGHNMTFKESLQRIANALGVKPPSICPSKSIAFFIGRLGEWMHRIFKTKSAITLESAHSAYANMTYSNEKIKAAIPIQFYSFEDTIHNVVAFDKRISKK